MSIYHDDEMFVIYTVHSKEAYELDLRTDKELYLEQNENGCVGPHEFVCRDDKRGYSLYWNDDPGWFVELEP